MAQRLSLTLLPDAIAICRLEADAELPQWAMAAPWLWIRFAPGPRRGWWRRLIRSAGNFVR